MSHPIRANYDTALAVIESGKWRVDAAAGVVYGPAGRSVGSNNGSGYIQAWNLDPKTSRRRSVVMHRVIWESVHGPIPDGLTVNHINGVKHDNRIENLELLTQMDNNRHAIRTGLRGPPPRGEQSANSRLTAQDAQDIYRRVWAGEMQADLAAEYDVHQTHISRIKHRRTWHEALAAQASGRL